MEAVDALYKRHEDFEATLQAQDERIRALNDMADKLIRAGHPDAKQCVHICGLITFMMKLEHTDSIKSSNLFAHPSFPSCRIDEKRRQVIARRERVKEKCQDRHDQLLASRAFQEFKRDADEVKNHMKKLPCFQSVL